MFCVYTLKEKFDEVNNVLFLLLNVLVRANPEEWSTDFLLFSP